MMDLYLLYGAPGVGKGTIAKKIPEDHILGTGGLLRQQCKGTDGQLVSDGYVNRLVWDELKKRNDYVVLDGYPRTEGQADFLLSLKGVRIKQVFELTCPDSELMNRLSLRQSCPCGASYHPVLKPAKEEGKCDLCGQKLFRRADDCPEIIRKRLAEYHQITEPVLEKFGNKVKRVDLSKDFNKAVEQIVNLILTQKAVKLPVRQKRVQERD